MRRYWLAIALVISAALYYGYLNYRRDECKINGGFYNSSNIFARCEYLVDFK